MGKYELLSSYHKMLGAGAMALQEGMSAREMENHVPGISGLMVAAAGANYFLPWQAKEVFDHFAPVPEPLGQGRLEVRILIQNGQTVDRPTT